MPYDVLPGRLQIQQRVMRKTRARNGVINSPATNCPDQLCERQRRKPMPKPNKYAHLAEQARQREAKLKAAYEEARELGQVPKPTKMQPSSCGAPLPTVQEWVRPGSKMDKLRKKQEARVAKVARQKNEGRLLSEYDKRRRAEKAKELAAKQAAMERRRSEQIYDECLDAVEQEDIQAAREEINRDRR